MRGTNSDTTLWMFSLYSWGDRANIQPELLHKKNPPTFWYIHCNEYIKNTLLLFSVSFAFRLQVLNIIYYKMFYKQENVPFWSNLHSFFLILEQRRLIFLCEQMCILQKFKSITLTWYISTTMIGSSASTLRDKEPRGMMVCLRQKEKDKCKSWVTQKLDIKTVSRKCNTAA